ncbi:MAG: HD-GYP domain-containing protein [Acidobacteria bacterium]|nr:HD-GYP domain-containing protein [Acidobacteriota bacterium]
MRCVAIEELKAGDRLARDVYAGGELVPLLRAGVRVSDSYRSSLQRVGITAVWIDDAFSEGIEPVEMLDEATKHRAKSAIQDAFHDVTRSMKTGGSLSERVVEDMHAVAEQIIRDIARNVHSALALNDLATADAYTLAHSLDVTTLGLSIGMRVMRTFGWLDALDKRRYDDVENRLVPLGVGLLLHDIGKLAVPPEILHKAGPLTGDEWTAVRAHPMLGIDILKKADGISPLARAVVRSHHERWNGSGYPDGKSGTDIHQFARIAAAADVFDALTSDRCYRAARAACEGYDFVVTRAGIDFDPEVVDIFKSFVAPYPPGTRVVLSDGHCGLVKDVCQDAVTRPVVRIVMDPSGAVVDPWEVDLSTSPELDIVGTEFSVPERTAA